MLENRYIEQSIKLRLYLNNERRTFTRAINKINFQGCLIWDVPEGGIRGGGRQRGYLDPKSVFFHFRIEDTLLIKIA